MDRETESILRTPNRQHVANLPDVLAQMQRSGSIHFVKSLPKTSLQFPRVRQTAKLTLPQQFVEENGDKFENLVTLRAKTSSGRSSKSWPVRICVSAAFKVQIVGGWPDFACDNRLEHGDFLIFLLREDAKSEFEVHMFRGPLGSPYFPVHQQDEHDEAFSGDIGEGDPALLPQTVNPRVPPRFSKRLVASHIARSTGELNTGQFEFPVTFVRTHGEHIHDSVKLQGECGSEPQSLHLNWNTSNSLRLKTGVLRTYSSPLLVDSDVVCTAQTNS